MHIRSFFLLILLSLLPATSLLAESTPTKTDSVFKLVIEQPADSVYDTLVKDICQKHQLPYRQENVFKRLRMTLDLMVGKTSLLVIKHA